MEETSKNAFTSDAETRCTARRRAALRVSPQRSLCEPTVSHRLQSAVGDGDGQRWRRDRDRFLCVDSRVTSHNVTDRQTGERGVQCVQCDPASGSDSLPNSEVKSVSAAAACEQSGSVLVVALS